MALEFCNKTVAGRVFVMEEIHAVNVIFHRCVFIGCNTFEMLGKDNLFRSCTFSSVPRCIHVKCAGYGPEAN